MKHIVLIILVMVFAAENALAACCGCVAATKAAHVTTDALIKAEHSATRTTINTEGLLLRQKVEEVGSVLQQETRSQTTAQERMFAAQNQLLQDLFTAAGMAQEQLNVQREYGDKSMPVTGCEGVDLGASVQNAEKVRKKIGQKTLSMAANRTDKYLRAKDTKGEVQRMLDEAPPPNQLAASIFNSIVETDDQKAVMESIFYLTDPLPPRQLTQNEMTKPQAVDYEAQRSLRNRHMALVQQVLAEHAARRIPSMPLEAWAIEQWREMGGQGSPPGLVDGNMSTNSMIDMLVDSRIGNPNWMTVTVQGLNRVGLAREHLYMEAASLYMQREQMRMTEQLLVLTALNVANQLTTQADERIKQLKVKMEN
jgi:hypothetical protein